MWKSQSRISTLQPSNTRSSKLNVLLTESILQTIFLLWREIDTFPFTERTETFCYEMCLPILNRNEFKEMWKTEGTQTTKTAEMGLRHRTGTAWSVARGLGPWPCAHQAGAGGHRESKPAPATLELCHGEGKELGYEVRSKPHFYPSPPPPTHTPATQT